MYRLIIVDDETLILNGLQNFIDWQSIGFELTGCFDTGETALAYILQNPVDAVLSDIKMPQFDGIKMVETLRKSGKPDIIVVFLSGYNDFVLAQSSIRLGVFDYILKPSDPKKIKEVFARVKTNLDQKAQKIKEEEKRHLIFKQVSELPAQEYFLKSFYKRVSFGTENEMENNFLYSTNRQLQNNYNLTTIFPKRLLTISTNSIEEMEIMKRVCSAIHVFITQYIPSEGLLQKFLYEVEDNWAVSIVYVNYQKNEISHILEALKTILASTDIMVVTNQKTVEVNAIDELYLANLSILYGIPNQYLRLEFLSLWFCRDCKLQQAIKEKNLPTCNLVVAKFKEAIFSMPRSVKLKFLNAFVLVCCAYIFSQCNSLQIKEDIRFIQENCILVENSILEMVFRRIFQDYFGMDRNNSLKHSRLCDEIVQYLFMHYSENITMKKLADQFSISPNYLGALFTDCEGEKLKDFLNRLRIEKAKILIQQGKMSLNQIADEVGFGNYEYFRKKYFSLEGKNPSDE